MKTGTTAGPGGHRKYRRRWSEQKGNAATNVRRVLLQQLKSQLPESKVNNGFLNLPAQGCEHLLERRRGKQAKSQRNTSPEAQTRDVQSWHYGERKPASANVALQRQSAKTAPGCEKRGRPLGTGSTATTRGVMFCRENLRYPVLFCVFSLGTHSSRGETSLRSFSCTPPSNLYRSGVPAAVDKAICG